MLVPESHRPPRSNVHFLIGLLLIVSFALNVCKSVVGSYNLSLDSYEYSEFLINFQGGFVRRGLFGEILFQIYNLFNFPLKRFLALLSFAALFFVVAFFLKKFHQNKYCWWLIFSPLFLNFTSSVIRKDFLLYIVLIGILYFLKSDSGKSFSRIGACILMCLGLFLHEAFIFFGYPIYVLLLLSDKRNRFAGIVSVAIPLILFFVLCAFKGNPEMVRKIVDSWNMAGSRMILKETFDSSIGALGWSLEYAAISHIRTNLSLNTDYSGIVYVPLISFLAYYMFSNFIFVFKKPDPYLEKSKLSISLLYSSALICLIPMFTILSCDTGRVFQYASIAAFSSFLLISPSRIVESYPKWYRHFIIRVD